MHLPQRLRERFLDFAGTRESWIFKILLDFKTVGFFLKISKEIGKAWRIRKNKDCFAVQDSSSKIMSKFSNFPDSSGKILNFLRFCWQNENSR